LSQITPDDAFGIAGRIVEQLGASIRAEANAAIVQLVTEKEALQGEVERLSEERGALLERIEELEDAVPFIVPHIAPEPDEATA
jgi:cell division protein FtsB